MLVDTHCHIERTEFEPDRGLVIQRARAAQVAVMVNPGVDVASSRRGCELAAGQDGLYAAVGVHPHEAQQVEASTWDALDELLTRHRPVAIGEVGLDYYKAYSPRERQREVFERFVALAEERGLPLLIHCRQAPLDLASRRSPLSLTGQAFEDLFHILKTHRGRVRGVMHCFSGTRQEAETAMQLGFDISFSGTVTFPNAKNLQEVAKAIPLERVVIETDAPYLAPQPVRGQRNEPAHLVYTAAKLAQLRQISVEAVAEATTANAKRLFNLP